MMPVAFVPFALMLAMATQSAAATKPAEAPKPAAENQDTSDKPVCRRVVATGSIMGKKVCKSREQWAAEAAQARDTMDNARSRGGFGR